MQTRVYVDGFNVYYGALKGTIFKWFNLVELARNMLPSDHELDMLFYLIARSCGVFNRQSLTNQQVYLNALQTNSTKSERRRG